MSSQMHQVEKNKMQDSILSFLFFESEDKEYMNACMFSMFL